MKSAAPLLALVLIAMAPDTALAGFAGTDVLIPAVARVDGAGGSHFYSTLWVTNLGSGTASFQIQFLRQGQPNPSPVTMPDTLAAGATRRYDNVVDVLGVSGGGALRIRSDKQLFVSSRTYDQPPGTQLKDSKGLFFSGIPASFAIGVGEVARLQGVTNGPVESYRYNFGLVETNGKSATVEVKLKAAGGGVTHTVPYVLGAYEARQVNAFEGFSPAVTTTNGLLEARVTAGTGKVILYGTQIAGTTANPGSNDSAGFEMSFKDALLSGTAGVMSLNGLAGALTLAAGANVTITPSGSTLTIAASGGGGGSGVPNVNGITGAVTIAGGGSTTVGTGGSTVTLTTPVSLPPSGSAGGALSGTYPNPGIGAGQVVKSLNSIKDDVTLVAGSNITITPAGSTITVAGTAGAGLTLPYSGTANAGGEAFKVTNQGGPAILGTGSGNPGVQGTSDSGDGVYGVSAFGSGVKGTSTGTAGVYGISANIGVYGKSTGGGEGSMGVASAGVGVRGVSDTNNGVYGISNSRYGVEGWGKATDGVHGESSGNGSGSGVAGINMTNVGVFGAAASGSNKAGVFDGGISVTNGSKSFVEPHPHDPEKQIRFVSLEGPENGTYFRGSGRLVGGLATIEVPEAFRMVTASEGLTVVVTPVGEIAVLACVRKSLETIVIKGTQDVAFDYMVNGVRKAMPQLEPIEANSFFVPHSPEDITLTRSLLPEHLERLVKNGTLHPDGTINMDTVRRLGWDKKAGWRDREPEEVRPIPTVPQPASRDIK